MSRALKVRPQSFATSTRPNNPLVPLTVATNSLSPLLNASVDCVVELMRKRCPPSMKHEQLVLLRVFLQPAWSLSVTAVR